MVTYKMIKLRRQQIPSFDKFQLFKQAVERGMVGDGREEGVCKNGMYFQKSNRRKGPLKRWMEYFDFIN